jgi:hypothetical protein
MVRMKNAGEYVGEGQTKTRSARVVDIDERTLPGLTTTEHGWLPCRCY